MTHPIGKQYREFWVTDDGGPLYQAEVSNRSLGANAIYVIEIAALEARDREISRLQDKVYHYSRAVSEREYILQGEIEDLKQKSQALLDAAKELIYTWDCQLTSAKEVTLRKAIADFSERGE